MKSITNALLASVALTAMLGTAALAADGTVTLGVVTAQTGPLAPAGKFQQNGFNLAVEQINKAGGFTVGGKTYDLALKTYDTRCNVAEGASAMERLATVDKVPVVLGELCSPVAAAEAPVAEDFKVPLIVTVPTAGNLTEQGNPYFFRINARDIQLNEGLAKYITDAKLTPLAFLAWNNDTGRGGIEAMKGLLPDSTKIGYVGYFNVGEVDFSSHVTNIRNSGAKAVVLLMDEEPGSLAIRQIRDAGVDVQLIGTLAMGSDRFLQRLNAKYLDGMAQYNSFPPNSPVDRIKTFSTAYKAKFGEETHGFAAQSYDAVFLAVEAMKAAGTTTDGAKIRDALSALTFNGVIGEVKFDGKGQANPPVYVTQWCADGTRKIVLPATLAADCGSG
ncbi:MULTISPECIES: ABC transporter substrate-binding protein [unclassified Chelatococcus]|uniref:ABC transporter substrate-binding protein n=1 Tax=unclassified Chelatococcus TaxID=2638111 RepID=UPI001BCEB477|nr:MULTISPECIES: ABC transporter substrate-binding protein [unclassified Chelatococcus]CAH1657502.1 Amino acid/amide ABC transporter substrate-binding protein (HAAT family) [Hyphomicrobiales bacterium]MBS7742300.1 ABC transporter substrate-binding protein [Chelatococcus sp. HY11]MBX3542582.1 ABC transporter substrate-binding protein [Chelatococcus sp.]MCO5075201.1 ABC transporter substrate-binding protein [Chelatococcus sp.]CAH1689169.1 Amino acid/amide ABC transporter substrate-binding protei